MRMSSVSGNSQIVFGLRVGRITRLRRLQESRVRTLARSAPCLRRYTRRSCLTMWDGCMAIIRLGRTLSCIYRSVLAPLPSFVAPPLSSTRRARVR